MTHEFCTFEPIFEGWTAFLVTQLVKNLPAVWETWVQSLGWENPLEKGKATHSSILAWRISWTIQSMGSQRVRQDWATFTSPWRMDKIWATSNENSMWKECCEPRNRGKNFRIFLWTNWSARVERDSQVKQVEVTTQYGTSQVLS